MSEPALNPFGTAARDVKAAHAHPLFSRFTPTSGSLLCSRPHRDVSAQLTKTPGGVIKPEQAQHVLGEYAFTCTVLKTPVDCPLEIREGSVVVVPQFGGKMVYDTTRGQETELWIVGVSEVMGVMED